MHFKSIKSVLGTCTSSDGIEECTANRTPPSILFNRSYLNIWNSLYNNNISLPNICGHVSVKTITLNSIQLIPLNIIR